MDSWAPRIGRRSNLSPSKGSSPILTPRRYGHPMDEMDSARRYEAAEGSASTSPPLAETPPYLRWAENLHYLLADPDGVELFEKYLDQENCSHLLKVRQFVFPKYWRRFIASFLFLAVLVCVRGIEASVEREPGKGHSNHHPHPQKVHTLKEAHRGRKHSERR